MEISNPRLFGVSKSNRDFNNPETWGKNQFNSSFPASLACYMYSKGLSAVYIKADKNSACYIDYINIKDLLGIDPLGENTFFSFETQYTPYQKYVVGSVPRNDLVVIDASTNQCISSYEIKLTALPDNATCNLDEQHFGSEIVVRPDTIVYLACSFVEMFNGNREEMKRLISGAGHEITDWTHASNVLPYIKDISSAIKRIVNEYNDKQVPVIIEPIWKTNGKSPQLSDNCLDIFVWSNFGMLNLFMPDDNTVLTSISRHTRSMIWLFKMLLDYVEFGHFDCSKIIDELSYNTKNDKAFSTNGMRTHNLMKCEELYKPRVEKIEIKNIILGGGQNLLSPERRFDAIIYNSPDLFKGDL